MDVSLEAIVAKAKNEELLTTQEYMLITDKCDDENVSDDEHEKLVEAIHRNTENEDKYESALNQVGPDLFGMVVALPVSLYVGWMAASSWILDGSISDKATSSVFVGLLVLATYITATRLFANSRVIRERNATYAKLPGTPECTKKRLAKYADD